MQIRITRTVRIDSSTRSAPPKSIPSERDDAAGTTKDFLARRVTLSKRGARSGPFSLSACANSTAVASLVYILMPAVN